MELVYIFLQGFVFIFVAISVTAGASKLIGFLFDRGHNISAVVVLSTCISALLVLLSIGDIQ